MTDDTQLTDAEKAVAASFGMTPEEYAAYKSPRAAHELAAKAVENAERERIKEAVKEALAERDGEAA